MPGDGDGIDDPEDISQKQRIKEILERRANTLEARNMAKMEVLLGDLDEERALLYYRSHLESLIYELWNVFENMQSDAAEKYLHEKPKVELRVDPPKELLEKVDDTDEGVGMPQPQYVRGSGLGWFVEAPERITREFSVQSFDPPGKVTETGETLIGWRELDAGLRAAFEFINEADIDANFSEHGKEAYSDYSWVENVLEDDNPEDDDE
jgi:hypothetical protein